MKRVIAILLLATLIFTFTACSDVVVGSTDNESASQPVTEEEAEAAPTVITVDYDSEDLDSSASSSDTAYIKLEGDTITVDGSGATVDGTTVTITAAGTYNISGTLNDGQIVVNAADSDKVVLVLDGADITCSTSAPIYVLSADKVVITLAEGTENSVTDGTAYVFENAESDEPNAAIFSKDDLTINGDGSLTVNANYNNGIVSKDDLKITGGTVTVNAVNDGIKGKDSIAVKDGVITVNAGSDGLQANNDEDTEKGYIAIEGGTLAITSGLDGIQAETNLSVSDGTITIVSGGGSVNSSSGANWGRQQPGAVATDESTVESMKGLKAGVALTITGGVLTIDSADDALHSNDSVTVSGGEIAISSGDDGIHANTTLEISGGDLTISKSYEGIESATITINDGTIHITASDDGVNVAGGNDGSALNGRPGQNQFTASGNYHLYINGGYIYIDAGGDGLDSNGPADMTGGVVLVNGPTNSGNGAMDYMSAFNVTGGLLVAVGSSGMAQAPSSTSTQYSVIHNFDSVQTAGTMIHIASADGEDILTFVPTKEYQSVVVSSPDLVNGATYTIYSGGSSTGTVTDGLYSDGSYTAGIEVTSFTISSIVTSSGAAGGGFGGGHGGGGRMGGGGAMPPGGGQPIQ